MALRNDVIIRFGGDAKGVNQTLSTIRSSVGSLRNYVTSIGAGFGIAAVFNKTIEATRTQNQALAQLDATIKSTGGIAGLTKEELVGLAAEMQRLTNYGDEAVISMLSVLGTFTQIRDGGVIKGATSAILDLSTKLGQDLKTSAVQVGKALNDPIAGITALKRVGVSFTDTQQKIIKGLVETNRLAEAQKLILGELNTEFGGSAQAAADPLIQLSNAFGDLFESSSDANAEISALTATLQDPATVAGFQSITSGVLKLTGGLAAIASGAANGAKALGESLAQLQGYVAPENLPAKINELTKEVEKFERLATDQRSGILTKWWYQDALEKARKTLEDLIKRQVALSTLGGGSGLAKRKADPVSTTKDPMVDASKGFKGFVDGMVEARKDAAIKTKSITQQQYSYEVEILNQYATERRNIEKGNVEGAQAAQEAQEAAFKKLADISKPTYALQYYQDLVGQIESKDVTIKIKVDRTEVDNLPTTLPTVTMPVVPVLQWGDQVPGDTSSPSLPAGQGITREVDKTGANP